MKTIFLQRRTFFFVLATVKTKPFLKVAWKGLSHNWGTQWVKSWGHAEKVLFSSHFGLACSMPAACLQRAQGN